MSPEVKKDTKPKTITAKEVKMAALLKLGDVFKKLQENLTATKQAFQVYKTKSFFLPDGNFAKKFSENLIIVEKAVDDMGSTLTSLIKGQDEGAGEQAAPMLSLEAVEPVRNSHSPQTTDQLAKNVESASITPPASEAGNDDEALSVHDQSQDTDRSSRKKRKRSQKSLDEGEVVKRPRRNLLDDYMKKEQSMKGVKQVKDEEEEKEEEFEVESILDCKRKMQGQCQYLVSWKGYGPADNTWEPPENLTGCEELLEQFYRMRIKMREAGTSEELSNMFIMDTSNRKTVEDAFLAHVRQQSKPKTSEVIALLAAPKPPVLKSAQEMSDFIEKALITRKRERYLQLVTNIKQDLAIKDTQNQRKKQLAELRAWERHMNTICSDPAKIIVENSVDLELPPMNFRYLNECFAGTGVTIPSEPPVGCECSDCGNNQKSCCASQMNSWFAYTKYSKLKVSLGTPIYECNKLCKCDQSCPNRVVQKGRTVQLCIFRTSNSRGWGVKALENIKKDSLVTEYVGEVITSEEAERRGKIYDAQGCTYLFDLDYNRGDQNPYTIDAAKCGNVSHFINHSCDPNLVVFSVWVNCLDPDLPRLALFAARDIRKGEELTFDYNSGLQSKQCSEEEDFSLTPDKNEVTPSSPAPLFMKTPKGNRGLQYGKTECRCGAANCRKYFF